MVNDKNLNLDNKRPTEEAIPYKPLEVLVLSANKHVSEEVYRDCFYRALGAFRAKVQKEKVLSHYKMAHVYESPSEYKRRKINESKRKRMEFQFLEKKMKDREEKEKEKAKKKEKEVLSDYDLF